MHQHLQTTMRERKKETTIDWEWETPERWEVDVETDQAETTGVLAQLSS